jgi:hydrogenase nickel incorporation protein HypA/HybF
VHELSIALGIVQQVTQQAEQRRIRRVEAITIRIGELSGIDKQALNFAWDFATEGSPAAGARLLFEDVPLKVRCSSCGVERHPESAWQLRCPDCPGAAPEIVSGRELHIVALEVPNDDDR